MQWNVRKKNAIYSQIFHYIIIYIYNSLIYSDLSFIEEDKFFLFYDLLLEMFS